MLVFAPASGLPTALLTMKLEASTRTSGNTTTQTMFPWDVLHELVATQTAVLLWIKSTTDTARLFAIAAPPNHGNIVPHELCWQQLQPRHIAQPERRSCVTSRGACSLPGVRCWRVIDVQQELLRLSQQLKPLR